jgi:rare lipoprotein A (peptidoglycan hydrolase)
MGVVQGMFLLWMLVALPLAAGPAMTEGLASWYGEAHRGRLMANGEKFDPVRLRSQPQRSVLVTITDRGPAKRLVNEGRIIDLTHAAFKELSSPEAGLVPVTVQPEEPATSAAK